VQKGVLTRAFIVHWLASVVVVLHPLADFSRTLGHSGRGHNPLLSVFERVLVRQHATDSQQIAKGTLYGLPRRW